MYPKPLVPVYGKSFEVTAGVWSACYLRLSYLPCFARCQKCRPVYITSSDVSNNKSEDPAIDSEERCACRPQARDERRLSEEFEAESLVQPQGLSYDPQRKSRGA
jgi:hypothetical protein